MITSQQQRIKFCSKLDSSASWCKLSSRQIRFSSDEQWWGSNDWPNKHKIPKSMTITNHTVIHDIREIISDKRCLAKLQSKLTTWLLTNCSCEIEEHNDVELCQGHPLLYPTTGCSSGCPEPPLQTVRRNSGTNPIDMIQRLDMRRDGNPFSKLQKLGLKDSQQKKTDCQHKLFREILTYCHSPFAKPQGFALLRQQPVVWPHCHKPWA